MKTTTLGAVADWGSGGTPRRAVAEYFGEGTPWLSIADLNDGVIMSAKESLTPTGVANSSAKIVPPGTIFVAMYGSIGKLGIAGTEMATSQAIAFAKPKDSVVDRRFLFHYLLSQRPQLQAFGRGGTQMNIGQGDLKSWPIPLPPLPEQRRIAAILDHADALRTKRRQVLSHLDALMEATFEGFFTEAPRRWSPLSELAEKVVVGHVGPTSEFFRPTGVPFLRTGNVGKGRIVRDGLAHVTTEFHERLKKSQIRSGDVLISRVITDEVRAAVAPSDLDGANCANIIVVRPSDRLLPNTVLGYISRSETQRRLIGRRVGSAQGVVNTTVLKELPTPIYSVEAQQRLADRVDGLSAHRAAVQRALGADNSLFASLQSRAFRGEL